MYILLPVTYRCFLHLYMYILIILLTINRAALVYVAQVYRSKLRVTKTKNQYMSEFNCLQQ